MSKVQLKKVKPYPIKGELKDRRGVYSGSILLLTQTGVLFETPMTAVQPGDEVELSFTLPVLNEFIQFTGVIMKIYNHFQSGPNTRAASGSAAQRVEVHIRDIEPGLKNTIERFIVQIGQRHRS